MSSCDRRRALGLIAAAGLAGGLSACGFTPAYGPAGSAGRLTGQVALGDPDGREGYLLQRRIEERLGRAPGGRYSLETDIGIGETDLGTTSTGATTRFRIIGTVDLRLVDRGSGTVLLSDRVDSFTSYSATGSNVATLAAERDALERLMTLLADRIVDRLILEADRFPA